jgi:GDP-4-dehydro-6-deoxy-D-mannose reductase
MIRALITGGTGFIGYHLARYLLQGGNEVICTHYGHGVSPLESERIERATYAHLDISDAGAVEKMIKEYRPDAVFHLAGQAYPVASWKDPARTFEINVLGTIYLFESLRKYRDDASVAVACSGAEYGDRAISPIKEETPLMATSPYGVSKAAADMLVYQYFRSYGMSLYSLRLFGTTGPGKAGDAINDFASQIVQLENEGTVKVGNVDTVRDISDVRDVVRAFELITRRGKKGEAYNVGSGQQYRIGELLEKLIALSGRRLTYVQDASLMRPSDESVSYPDTSKIRAIGYVPAYTMDMTLRDVLTYHQKLVASNTA